MPNYIGDVRKLLAQLQDELGEGAPLPGFCLPKGLGALMPMVLQGLRYGITPEVREQAALAMGDMINLTSEEAFKPYVSQIAGPLIRVMGDRFPGNVKAAILQTTGTLLVRGGQNCKPFITQFQTTFVKALNDSERKVRDIAAKNLGQLMTLNARVDPLVTELVGGLAGADSGAKEGMVKALHMVLLKGGATASQKVLDNAGNVLFELMEMGEEEPIQKATAQCLGGYAGLLDADKLSSMIR